MQAEATKTKPRRRRDVWVKKDDRLFTLEVFITDGPLSPAFVKKNPEISRKIEMRGDDTLDMLHFAIFDAFNRHDPHMYEYQVGGKGPMDPEARRYVLIEMMEGRSAEELADMSIAGNVEHVTIGSLGLKEGDPFGYWFDYGDDWWHQINVVSIAPQAKSNRKYPCVVGRVGKSPPQYPR